jgi:ubiquitin conjugation factor E4 B
VFSALCAHATLTINTRPYTLQFLPPRRAEHEQAVDASDRSMRTAAVLGLHTLLLLWTFAGNAHVAAMLVRPEMVGRVAQSLNFYLSELSVGQAHVMLTLHYSAKRMAFEPRRWIELLIDIYLSLDGYDGDAFVVAVVDDERLADEAMLRAGEHAAATMSREKTARWAAFMLRCDDERARQSADERDLGEVPPEFLDPILNTLMTEPVTLPTSGVTVDRAVIARHLLSDDTDPFNRQKLSVEDLVPATALRERIEAFLAARRVAGSGVVGSSGPDSGGREHMSGDIAGGDGRA